MHCANFVILDDFVETSSRLILNVSSKFALSDLTEKFSADFLFARDAINTVSGKNTARQK
jgi:hypothetical protein